MAKKLRKITIITLIMSMCVQNVQASLPLDTFFYNFDVYPDDYDNNFVFVTVNEVQDEVILRERAIANFNILQQAANLSLDGLSRENILNYFNSYINNPLTNLYADFTEAYVLNISGHNSNEITQLIHNDIEIVLLNNNIHNLILNIENYAANVISPILRDSQNISRDYQQRIFDDLVYFRDSIFNLYQTLINLKKKR